MANTQEEWTLLKELINVYRIGETVTITLRDGVEGVASEADGPKPSLIIGRPPTARRQQPPAANRQVEPGAGRQHRPL